MKPIDEETFFVPFTRLQLMKVFDHIQRIDRHFDECCGHDHDRCSYQERYDELYSILRLAGIPDELTPFGGMGEEAMSKFKYQLDKLTQEGKVLYDKDVSS
jgi:hypothetical protein